MQINLIYIYGELSRDEQFIFSSGYNAHKLFFSNLQIKRSLMYRHSSNTLPTMQFYMKSIGKMGSMRIRLSTVVEVLLVCMCGGAPYIFLVCSDVESRCWICIYSYIFGIGRQKSLKLHFTLIGQKKTNMCVYGHPLSQNKLLGKSHKLS